MLLVVIVSDYDLVTNRRCICDCVLNPTDRVSTVLIIVIRYFCYQSLTTSLNTLPPGRGVKYCVEYVCLFVRLTVRSYNSTKSSAIAEGPRDALDIRNLASHF